MLSAIETRMLFFPTRASEDWVRPDAVGLMAEDVDLATADGTRIHAWWCPGKHDTESRHGEVLLYCHGNAGNLSHRADAIVEMQQYLPIPVLIFDYPGYGRSEGAPSEKGCYAAADAAVDWLVKDKGFAPEQVILFGESLGGGVVVELATRRPYRALILVRTFTSIPDMARLQFRYLPVAWLVRNRFDNLAKIDRCAGPLFIAHGDCDSLIPYSQAQRLFAKAREPKRFFPMPGCDHNDPLSPPFYQALHAFLDDRPGPPVTTGSEKSSI